MGIIKSIGGAVLSPFFRNAHFGRSNSKTATSCPSATCGVMHGSLAGYVKLTGIWTLLRNGDVANIKELWLICPPNRMSPFGNTAKFEITEPYTAFQMKTASFDALGANGTTFEGLIIGKVDDKVSGDCTFFVWDNVLKAMSVPQKGNVYTGLPSWRDGIANVKNLSFDVLGLRL